PSFDLETEIDATYPTEHIDLTLINDTLPKFKGTIMQVPPVFSAVKIDGRRAYKFARKGKEVELAPKQLHISDIELLGFDNDIMTVRVVCSKGTYIRALARDIGEALGTGAHLIGLRRTRVGQYTIDDCLTIEQAVDMINDSNIIIENNNGSPRDGDTTENRT
ncbi:MAG: tRNA pseudouridine(55) synthase, partial [Muribaculaceae bacterium]|nr:tRNA pseudouridine(55) synthase [Muribaculaceae bacterium]